MNISIERDAFLAAIDDVRGVVEARTTIPILSNVMLTFGAGSLAIVATNLDIEAKTSSACESVSSGSLTLPATMLADIVKRFAKGSIVHMEALDNGARVQIKCGRAKFHIGALPSDDFPEMKNADHATSFEMDGSVLAKALQKTKFAISTEETRYYLNGTFAHVVAGKLVFVSTDGHRLCKFSVPAPDGSDNIAPVIIPSKACIEIEKLAAKAKSVSVSIAPSVVIVSDGVTTIRTKTIDGSFPDYARVIPQNNGSMAVVDRVDWSGASSRVATVASERGRGVRCFFAAGRLDLSVSSPDGGEGFDSVDAEYDGAEIQIGFNARYLAEVLGAFDGDKVSIALADGQSPAILTSSANPEMTIVVMPMRV